MLMVRLGFNPAAQIAAFLMEYGVQRIAFADAHWREALAAYQRFGRGRHPARLNFGDCLSYAIARLAGQELLCTGDDFPQTDIPVA
ncbi:MAG: type II toxin-antitoxin system VapC family toxin [Deltaproteobacteria bacterium]|nr:type II toxin-antitoxin system VapC family toxin [Deltaproteobacteria bacterium]